MQILRMLKGLPGCGKTTYANELVAQGWKRVNKDDLRAMIDCSKWSKANEKDIMEIRDLVIIHYLDSGYNVVVDDTNFSETHRDTFIEIADNCDALFEEKFFDVPVNECVERDLKRGDKSVGGDVIFRMYYKYIRPNIAQPLIDMDLPFAYIFDVDGTLALMKDRSPYDWSRVGEDELNVCVAAVLKSIHVSGLKILIVSGRDSVCAVETFDWFKKHDIPFDHIFMREEGDTRKDSIIKEELYNKFIKDKYNVLGVFDDRDSVVALWRSFGLKCFQVDYGSF